MAAYERNLDANTACEGRGRVAAQVIVRQFKRKLADPIHVDLLDEVPDMSRPAEVVRQIAGRLPGVDPKNILAMGIHKLCEMHRKQPRKDSDPRPQSFRLERIGSLAIVGPGHFKMPVQHANGRILRGGIGELRLEDRHTGPLAPAIYLPAAVTDAEILHPETNPHPVTDALQLTGISEGAVYLAQRGLETIVQREDVWPELAEK